MYKYRFNTEEINPEEIKPKNPEPQENRKEISLDKIDEALVIEEGILDSLNKYSKGEIFNNVDFEDKTIVTSKLNEKHDDVAYTKAGFWKKYENLTRFGLRKETYGLTKSKERGLLDKTKIDEDVADKNIEIGDTVEKEELIKKTMDVHKDLKKEDLDKRVFSKKFIPVAGAEKSEPKILKVVESRRTEQGMIDAAGKLLNEKIESLEKGVGTDLAKEKEGLEKHHSSVEKFDKMTEYLSEATKKELSEKLRQEGSECQERIKEKEENLQQELDVFRSPFQERLGKTNELVDNFSGILKDTKEAESKYNTKLKSINVHIQEAQKSGLLEDSKKELVKELELKKAEFERKAKEFGVRKNDMEAKLGILKNNKTELEKTISRVNSIGKTKKEITEEKKAKEESAKKTEKNATEPFGKEEKEKISGKSGSADFAEDWSFMKERKNSKIESEADTDSVTEETENVVEKTFTEKEIENIVKTHLKVMGLFRIQDKKIQDQITRNAIVNVKKMIEKDE